MIAELSPYIKKYRLPAALCPIVVILEVVGDILMPVLMSRIVDIGITNQDVSFIVKTGLLMIGLALLALSFGALSNRLAAVASQGFGAEIRQGLFEKIQTFSFANLDHFSIPSLITRLTSDINNLQQTMMMALRLLFRAPFMMVLALIMALRINNRLALVFLIAGPLLGIALAIIMTRAHPRFKKLQERIDFLNTSVQENLINIRVVKAFVRADEEKGKFRRANDELTLAARRAVRLVILNQPIMQLIMYACIIAILWFGGIMITAGQLQTGELISFITYVNQILISMMMLSMVFLMFTRAKASADRVLEVMQAEPDIRDNPAAAAETISAAGQDDRDRHAAENLVADGSIEFRQVAFRYAEGTTRDTLADINLRIESGETIGIIGATGSAKTSLVQLIPRLYDVTAGQVLVGGRDVRDYPIKALRDAVAVVLQNNTLFSGSIRDNLRWGDAAADDEEATAVCRIAQIADFIESLPAGLDTELGQGGVNLSGGQKQRLCIARALLKKPRVLILDDSTSAVDMATDAKLRESLRTQMEGVTKLIIAQRISSVQQADRILVMDDGRINGIGSHDELMRDNEIYRDVYLSQQEGVLAG